MAVRLMPRCELLCIDSPRSKVRHSVDRRCVCAQAAPVVVVAQHDAHRAAELGVAAEFGEVGDHHVGGQRHVAGLRHGRHAVQSGAGSS